MPLWCGARDCSTIASSSHRDVISCFETLAKLCDRNPCCGASHLPECLTKHNHNPFLVLTHDARVLAGKAKTNFFQLVYLLLICIFLINLALVFQPRAHRHTRTTSPMNLSPRKTVGGGDYVRDQSQSLNAPVLSG